MNTEQAPLYVAAYDLTRAAFALAGRLPRQHRSILARHLQASAFDLLTGVSLALRFRERRGARLLEADEALTRLRLALRIGRDEGVISNRSALRLIGEVDDIGRQLGGWRRQCAAPTEVSDVA